MMSWYVWIDTPTADENILGPTDFSSDSQRESGFSAGTTASAIRANSALRQANLVAVALMNAIGDTAHSLVSDVDDVVNAIKSKLAIAGNNFTTDANITATKFIGSVDITTLSASTNVVKLQIGSGQVYEKTINDVARAASASTATTANTATTATTAKRVEVSGVQKVITYDSSTRTLSFNNLT